MTIPTLALALTASALLLAACGRKDSPATVDAVPATAAGAATDAAATAAAPHTPGVGEAAYNTPAPMSSPTSSAGAGNPPSDVMGPR
jgi:hypothetical protein